MFSQGGTKIYCPIFLLLEFFYYLDSFDYLNDIDDLFAE